MLKLGDMESPEYDHVVEIMRTLASKTADGRQKWEVVRCSTQRGQKPPIVTHLAKTRVGGSLKVYVLANGVLVLRVGPVKKVRIGVGGTSVFTWLVKSIRAQQSDDETQVKRTIASALQTLMEGEDDKG